MNTHWHVILWWKGTPYFLRLVNCETWPVESNRTRAVAIIAKRHDFFPDWNWTPVEVERTLLELGADISMELNP